ncbi:hypothetical protein SteCoe_3826 [Stentor coeruleus]|uniref:Uncharacterized protein n=1 Tax=Stentor coeruleus TaxID=5963 RepID=A0A1R2CW69_9CILI|nr:hypothetical protein SteCoe_3826 [Stentor coeruleus]
MSIEEDLIKIHTSIHKKKSQLLLYQILTEEISSNHIQSSKTCEILQEISKYLSKSLLEFKLFHMIKPLTIPPVSKKACPISKSILSLDGHFIWYDDTIENIFKCPKKELPRRTIFSFMSKDSLKFLNSKYSKELLGKRKRIIMSYILIDGTELTSRCTIVKYSLFDGICTKGVYLETRKAQHKVMKWKSKDYGLGNEEFDRDLKLRRSQISKCPFFRLKMYCCCDDERDGKDDGGNDWISKKRKIGECEYREYN